MKFLRSETIWIGNFFVQRKVKVDDESFKPLSVTMKGVKNQLEDVVKTDDGSNRKLVKKDDFVINSRSDRKGASGIALRDGSVSLINIVLKPKNIYPGFVSHLFKSYYFKEEFFRNGKGIHWDLWTTRWDQLKNILIPLPPENEQRQICSFLDTKNKEIDLIIKKIEDKNVLLNEKKFTLISNCTTKGLNPSIKLKKCFIDWIDKTPEHWKIIKPKYILNKVTRPVDQDDDVITCFRDGTVTLRKNKKEDGFTFSIKEHGYQQILPGDLVVHEMDGFAGAIGISDSKGKSTPVYTVIEPNKNIDLLYFSFLLREMSRSGKIESMSRSIREDNRF